MDATGPETADATPVLTDNPARSRYEVHVGGELAGYIMYGLRGRQIDLIHTEVNPRFQGAGLASHLARFSLDDARARDLAVLPTCPYVRKWIRQHPDYADLVPDDRRAEFGV
jgi:uncharacterized protein